ncbi:MAG: retropepsin-like aspartic protease [Myxococcota bacterium]
MHGRLTLGWVALLALLGGCAPALGRARVSFGEPVPVALVQPSTDTARWYLPMDTTTVGPVVWFVDTGYTYSTCDDDLVDALGLRTRGTVRVRGELGRARATKARLPAFELGGHRVGSLVCQVRDLATTSSLDDPDEVPIAGVIGMDVLRAFRVVFDPADGALHLDDPARAAPLVGPGVTRLRRSGVHGLRTRLEVRIGRRVAWPILDTGAGATYLDGAALGLEPSSTLDNVVVRGTGAVGHQVRRMIAYEVDAVRVGGQKAGAATVIDRDRGWWAPGLLGLDLLGRFHQEYDFARGRARLTPVAPSPVPQFSAYWPPDGGPPARLLDEPPDAWTDPD